GAAPARRTRRPVSHWPPGLQRRGRVTHLQLEQVATIMLQLGNRLADVIQRLVRTALLEAFLDLRRPALGENLQGRDIQVAIVEIALQSRHVTHQETPILTDAVAADR